MFRAILFSFFLISLGGCTHDVWTKDFVTPQSKLSAPKFQLLELGMSKNEVISALGDPDQVVGAKMQGKDKVETWEYFRVAAVPGQDVIAERYHVIFTNGKLTSYDSSGDFKQQVNIR